MDRLLPSESGWMAGRRDVAGSPPAGGITMAPQASPPPAEAGAGRGGRDPTPVSKRGGCSATAGLATCPRRSRYPSLAGRRLMRSLPIWTPPTARDSGSPSRRAGQRTGPDPAADVWARGRWQRCQGRVRTWRPCGPIVSPSRPGSGGRGRAARGRHRGCSRPDRGGRPAQHGGSGGAWAWAALAASPPNSQPHRIPDGWFRGWQRFRKPARRVARTDPTSGTGTLTRAGQAAGTSHGKDNPGKAQDKEVARRLW